MGTLRNRCAALIILGGGAILVAIALVWMPVEGQDLDAGFKTTCGSLIAPRMFPDLKEAAVDAAILNADCYHGRRSRSLWVGALGGAGTLIVAFGIVQTLRQSDR